jgi:C-methyltransferase C-terminal domain/Putative zinc binding domain/Methyltransferase domain
MTESMMREMLPADDVYEPLIACRICGSKALTQVLDLGTQALTGVFPSDAATDVPSGPVTLVLCDECALLQLGQTYNASEMYGANYGYRSGLNQSMVRHLEAKVAALVKRVGLEAGDVVLDIGSNDSTLLRAYPDRDLRLAGIDPSAGKFRRFYPGNVALATEFFSADSFRRLFGDAKAKIVTSIAMLYDLPTPQRFFDDVASILADDGIWHTEQSYMPTMMSANAYDTVCQEHLEYYGLAQIERMATSAGLRIVDVDLNDINGGSFAVTMAKQQSSRARSSTLVEELLSKERAAALGTVKPYQDFAARVAAHRRELIDFVRQIRQSGKTLIGYGASTKGNVLLQYCGFTAVDIPCIAEVNPDKFGCFTPGTRIPIVSEDEARRMKPDYMMVLPWHFRENTIKREQEFLKRGGKLLFPLPQIEVVG